MRLLLVVRLGADRNGAPRPYEQDRCQPRYSPGKDLRPKGAAGVPRRGRHIECGHGPPDRAGDRRLPSPAQGRRGAPAGDRGALPRPGPGRPADLRGPRVVPLPAAQPGLPGGLRADPRGVPGHLPRHREGRGAPRGGPLGPRRRDPGGARAGADRSRVRPQLADLAAGLVRHHQRLSVRRAERGEPGGDRLRRGARRSLPGAADRAAVPGAVPAEALPLPRGDAEDARRLLPRGRRHGGEAADRHRGLRGRADPDRAPPLPRLLRVAGLPVPGLRSAASHLRGRAAAPRRPRDRHRVQAAPGERVPRAHHRAAAPPPGREGPGGHAGEPVPLQAHPQEGHLCRADRRRAPAAVHSRRARRHRRPRPLDAARRSKGGPRATDARSISSPTSAATATGSS